MSKKYLLVLILIIFLSMGIASAQDNGTDDAVSVSDDSAEVIDAVDEPILSEDDDYVDDGDDGCELDDEFDDSYYYDNGVIKAPKFKTTYNSGKTYKVKVVSYYDKTFPLNDVKLKLRAYSKNSYKDFYAYTGDDGVAKFKLSKLGVGTHKIVISAKQSYTLAKKATSSVKIYKAKTKVYAPKVTAKHKKSKKFKIKVKYKSTNKAVSKVKISVKVGYKTYTLKTNSKGLASFNTKYLSPGTYKVIIKSKNSKFKIYKKSKIVVKAAKKKTSSRSTSSSSSGGGYYVGSINSDKFHYPSCSAAKRIKSYNLISFSSRSSAFNSGYYPCGICHP